MVLAGVRPQVISHAPGTTHPKLKIETCGCAMKHIVHRNNQISWELFWVCSGCHIDTTGAHTYTAPESVVYTLASHFVSLSQPDNYDTDPDQGYRDCTCNHQKAYEATHHHHSHHHSHPPRPRVEHPPPHCPEDRWIADKACQPEFWFNNISYAVCTKVCCDSLYYSAFDVPGSTANRDALGCMPKHASVPVLSFCVCKR